MKEGRSQRNLKTAMRGPVTFSNLNTAKTSCVTLRSLTDMNTTQSH